VSIGLLEQVGAAGAAWMRMVLAALGFLAVARPRLWRWGWRNLRAPTLLGVVTAGMLLPFQAAIGQIPLGSVVAIGFLGPLTVAALHAETRRALAWPALALAGVVLLTQPWAGHVNLVGVALAVIIGAVLLHQIPDVLRMLGTAFVVLAGIAAERTGHREAATTAGPVRAVLCTADGGGSGAGRSTEEVLLHVGRAADRAHP
jgi:threonine/homoserine efflux transporter RhtA